MSTYILQIDSDNQLEIDPEFDFKDSAKKVENRYRTRSGAEFVYRWGEYSDVKFTVMYVNSNFKSVVNSWWSSNSRLQFYPTDDPSDVTSVRLINKRQPIDKFIRPYKDQFKGVIQLGAY